MKQMKNIYFTIAWIVSLILGILLCFTFFGAILGIPLLMASSKFSKARRMMDEELINNRSNLFGWGIFLAIVLFPTLFGLIVVLIFAIIVNNYIKDLEQGKIEEANKSFGQTVKEGASKTWNGFKETFGVKSKLEKQKDQITELQKMKEDGLITEEEYDVKRKKILDV